MDNLKGMSVKELLRLYSRVGSVLKRKKHAIAKARARVAKIAAAAGVSAKELTERKGPAPKWQRRKKAVRKAARKVAKAKVAYRHPTTGQTWSGYGPTPAWLKEARKTFKSVELAVN